MYHLKTPLRTQLLFALSTLCLTLSLSGSVVLAATAADPAKSAEPKIYHERVEARSLSYPLPPPKKALRKPPTTVEIYQLDTSPLGNRESLLMVHGLRGEFNYQFRWDRVVKHFQKHPELMKRYKIFFARYNTHVPLATVTPLFKQSLMGLSNATGNKPISVVALSMGGNLLQDAMEDHDVNNAVKQVMTMGTPFHGSPLFCFDWMEYSMLKQHLMPWIRADLGLSYRLYFDRHKNLLEDLRWDNSDNLIPQIGEYKVKFPFRVTGNLTPDTMGNPRLAALNEEVKARKNKFITYGGYILNPYLSNRQPNGISRIVRWPFFFSTTTVPEHMAREHPVLRQLNRQIASAVVRPTKPGQRPERYVYALNDGITPLVSALYMPDEVLGKREFSREMDVKQIKGHLDVGRGRVFRNVDHVTFIDGHHSIGRKNLVRDELNPGAGKKHIFDWIMSDLLESEEQIAARISGIENKLQPSPYENQTAED